MKKFVVLFLIIICSGCSRTKLLYEKDGEKIYRSLCGGIFLDMTNCYSEAYDNCQSEFDIVDIYNEDLVQTSNINIDNSINISTYPTSNAQSPVNSFMSGYNSQKKRYLVYKCKK